ncbi:hypothetical protein [Microbacterium sp. NPDC055683]
MNDKSLSGFKRIYALRPDVLLDVDGYRESLRAEHPDIYAYTLEVSDLELQAQVDAALRILSRSEGNEGGGLAPPAG